jgi:hypothetical protein
MVVMHRSVGEGHDPALPEILQQWSFSFGSFHIDAASGALRRGTAAD